MLTAPFTSRSAPSTHRAMPATSNSACQEYVRARRKDGSVAHVEATAGSVRGVDGRVTHWVLAFADRTELEELREKLNALCATASGV